MSEPPLETEPEPSTERFRALGLAWGVPILLTVAYLILMDTSDARPLVKGLMFCGLLLVLFLWVMFRELTLHASLSRAVAMGQPHDVHRLAAPHTRRRGAGRRAPFWIYQALGYDLEGKWAEALDALDHAELRAIAGNARPTWTHLATCARVAALIELGRTDEARTAFERVVVATRTSATGDMIAALTKARLDVATGHADVARPVLDKLAADFRIGPSTRAIANVAAGRAAQALGDDAAAKAHFAEAAKLAPYTWMAHAGR